MCVCAGGRACGFAFHDVLIKMNLIRQEFDILPFQFRTLSFISARCFLVVWQKSRLQKETSCLSIFWVVATVLHWSPLETVYHTISHLLFCIVPSKSSHPHLQMSIFDEVHENVRLLVLLAFGRYLVGARIETAAFSLSIIIIIMIDSLSFISTVKRIFSVIFNAHTDATPPFYCA